MPAYITKVNKTYLQSTLSADATSVLLRELVDSKGGDVEMADLGDWAVIVVKDGSQIEMIKFDGLSRAVDGKVTLSVETNGRNIDPTFPYTSYASGLPFQAGAEVIITNDPLSVSQFVNSNNAYTWVAQQTFTLAPKTSAVPTADEDIVNKLYADTKVSKTGNEDIAGNKTFEGDTTFEGDVTFDLELIIPEGTTDSSALTKAQIQSIATGDTPIISGFNNATFTYNANGTVNTITNTDLSITYTVAYNADGTVNTITDGTSTWTMTYNASKQVTQITQS